MAELNSSRILSDSLPPRRSKSTVLLLTLLLFSTTICYIDRQALSIAAPFLRTRFNMSNLNYSEVLTAFLLAYALFQPVVGRFIDWIGTRAGLALAVVFWSVASMLHATVRGAPSLGFFQFLWGLGKRAVSPGASKSLPRKSLRSCAH